MAYKKPKITNSQFINIEQTPAAIGYRVLAYIVDAIVISMYYSAVGGFVSIFGSRSNNSIIVYATLFVLLLPMLYQPICEQLFNGRTLGKMATGTRVVMQDGSAITFSSSFLRWVLSLIDIDMMGCGLVVMLCNKRNMRLGDLAAGTIVIRDKLDYSKMYSLTKFTFLSEDYKPTYPFAADMTWGQINFINHTATRQLYYTLKSQKKKNIEMLANKIANMYNIELEPNSHNDFLCTIVSDYNYYTWHDNV